MLQSQPVTSVRVSDREPHVIRGRGDDKYGWLVSANTNRSDTIPRAVHRQLESFDYYSDREAAVAALSTALLRYCLTPR